MGERLDDRHVAGVTPAVLCDASLAECDHDDLVRMRCLELLLLLQGLLDQRVVALFGQLVVADEVLGDLLRALGLVALRVHRLELDLAGELDLA